MAVRQVQPELNAPSNYLRNRCVLETNQDPHVVFRLCIALVGFYIDDWAVLTIHGHELISNQVVTAVWELFGLPEEPSKTLDFSTS